MPQPVVHPLLLGPSALDIFIGRERELGQLQDALDHACTGRGQLVLLAGEPGVGKTCLAEKFTTLARHQHVSVLWGRCWEGDGTPAFWPWVQIVRTYIQQCPSDTLTIEMGNGAGDIAHVVTEVRERLAAVPPSRTGESDSARFRFFDSLVAWLKRAAIRQPLLLILDDLHWAATSSLLLLRFFARALQDAHILVLGTYRDTDVHNALPLSEALGALVRESQHVTMVGLAREEVAQFIHSTLGSAPSTGLVTSVYERTEGNPFFVSELVQVLAREGHFPNVEETSVHDIGLPQSVRATIRHRLIHVSLDCRHLLSLAAVIGREFSLEILQEVRTMGEAMPLSPLLPLLDEALAASLIEREKEGTNILDRPSLIC